MAKYVAADDYPIGVPPEAAETMVASISESWGTETLAAMQAPSRANDNRLRRWFAKLMRSMASPRAVNALLRAAIEIDARPILPLISAPTLVLHRRDYPFVPIQLGRYLAEHIPGAKLIEQAGGQVVKTTGDGVLATFDGPGRVTSCWRTAEHTPSMASRGAGSCSRW